MKINPVETMHTLSNYSYEVIKSVALDENISIPKHASKVELIAVIIAERAARESRDSVYKMVREGDRTKYHLRTEDDNYYLRLTDTQAAMLEWCSDRGINFYNSEIDEIGDVEWEAP